MRRPTSRARATGSLLPLTRMLGKSLPHKALARGLDDHVRRQNLPRLGRAHQPGGEVDRVPQHAIGAPGGAAVRARAHPPTGEADLQGVQIGQPRGQILDGQGRGGRPDVVVFVGDGRAKGGIEIAALVADGELDQAAVKAGQDVLDLPDKAVQLLGGVLVVVVVDAREAQEEGHRRAQFGQKLAQSAAQPLVDRGQQPLGRSPPGPGRLRPAPARASRPQPRSAR